MIHGLIGSSAAMAKVIQFIAAAAPQNSTVLIEGESGTGKELVACALHRNSRRSGGAFVAVNCAALPESLRESELFGYERGAFTGAAAWKKGKFELASGGTLFLDEIGELSLGIQGNLLRALQERTIDRIGGARPVPVDIRLIAATNKDLKAAVARGEFRQDLYYRLNVLTLRTPPLRERPEDIPLLARSFLLRYAREKERAVTNISSDAETILENYDWPGNVRQLQHAIEHGVVFASTDVVLPEEIFQDLPREAIGGSRHYSKTAVRSYYDLMDEFKRHLFERAFHHANGDYKKAAAQLGLHPRGMHRLLNRMHLTHLLKS